MLINGGINPIIGDKRQGLQLEFRVQWFTWTRRKIKKKGSINYTWKGKKKVAIETSNLFPSSFFLSICFWTEIGQLNQLSANLINHPIQQQIQRWDFTISPQDQNLPSLVCYRLKSDSIQLWDVSVRRSECQGEAQDQDQDQDAMKPSIVCSPLTG